MVLKREVTTRIKEVLGKHPEGLSITDLVKSVAINRNTAGRYLENLLLSGQVEMRRFGMSKLYTLAKRLPVSSALSLSSELVLQLDMSQRVIFANDPLLVFLNTTAKSMMGKNIEYTPFSIAFEEVFPDLLERLRQGLKGVAWRGELGHSVNDRYFFARITPAVFNEGAKGVSIFLEDITDQKHDAERIKESEARLRGIFTVSPIGIGVIEDRVFHEVNDCFCHMTGYSADELIGRSARMLYPSDEAFRATGAFYMGRIRAAGSASVETQWIRKDGAVIDALLNTTPLDPANVSGGITFAALDITDRKKADAALRESEARLSLALSASETGMWEMDFPGGIGSIDEGAAAILGYQKEEIGTIRAAWDSLTHPDDVPLIAQRVADCLGGKTAMFESEHRMRHKEGHWVWVLGRGKVTYTNPDGSVKRISGTLKDITARKRTEQALKESATRLQLALDGSAMGMWELVLPSGMGTGDERCSAIFGYRSDDHQDIPLDWDALTHPDDLPLVRKRLADHLAGKTPMYESEHRMLHSSGRWIWVISRGMATPALPDGRRRVLGTMLDITPRKRDEQALRESEEKYRNVVEQLPQGLAIIQEGRHVFANSAMPEIFGISRDEYMARSPRDLLNAVQPDDRDRIQSVMAENLEGRATYGAGEFRLRRTDGEERWILAKGSRISYNGKPAVQVVFFDFTDRRRAEEALHESEERLRQIADNMAGVFYVHDRITNRFIYVSPAYEKIWQRSCESLIADPYTYLEAVHPDDLPKLLEAIRRDLEEEKFVDWEYRIIPPDGSVRWIHSQNYPVRDAAGNVYRTVGIAEDITARRNAEDALRESEDRYRKLAEISPNAILLHCNGKVLYANPALARILRVDRPGDLVGRDVLDLVHPDYHGTVRTNISLDLTGESSPFTELQLIRSDGTAVLVEGQGVGTMIDGKPAVLVTISDITERSEALMALRESEERYRGLIERSLQGYMVVRGNRVVFANPAMQQISGYTTEEFTGFDPEQLLETVHPGDRDRIRDLMKDRLNGLPVPAENEYRIIRKDGTTGWVRALSTLVVFEGIPSVQVVVLDISHQKEAEDTLRASEDRYRTLAEASQDIVFVIGKDDRVEYVNSYGVSLTGLPADQVIGRPRGSLFTGDTGVRQKAGLRRVFGTGMPVRTEGPLAFSGTVRWYDHHLVPITDAEKKVTAVLGISRDITDRRAAEQVRRESEDRYRALLEQIFDAVAVHRGGKITSLNERACQILGAAVPGDLIGRSIFDLIHPDSRKDLQERLQEMASDPRKPAPVLREKFFRVNGVTVDVEVMAAPSMENGEPAVRVWFREWVP